jgi:protein-S-isoprenylcysteine O-methyltransferase Ste14
MKTLKIKAFSALAILFFVMAAIIFIPAGTIDYWQAWVFLFVYFLSSLMLTFYLMRKEPKLLKRRMRGGPFAEKDPIQRIIMSLTSLGFICLLVIPAFDHRFAWSNMPTYFVIAGDFLLAVGWLALFFVVKKNEFASATIEVTPDQKVVSTGPYAIVRHPMYASALVMLAGIPIALGSWWGLLVLVAMMPALIWRLLAEEKFLAKNLVGYAEYRKKVRYRLLPLIW